MISTEEMIDDLILFKEEEQAHYKTLAFYLRKIAFIEVELTRRNVDFSHVVGGVCFLDALRELFAAVENYHIAKPDDRSEQEWREAGNRLAQAIKSAREWLCELESEKGEK